MSIDCKRCGDTTRCQTCSGYGEIKGYHSGYAWECAACNGYGHCVECCCEECIENDIRPCAGHDDDE